VRAGRCSRQTLHSAANWELTAAEYFEAAVDFVFQPACASPSVHVPFCKHDPYVRLPPTAFQKPFDARVSGEIPKRQCHIRAEIIQQGLLFEHSIAE